MSRWTRALLIVCCIAIPLTAVIAEQPDQQPPFSTEEPSPPAGEPPPFLTPGAPVATSGVPGGPPGAIPTEQQPIVVPTQPIEVATEQTPSPQDEINRILLNTRADLELLAGTLILGPRPAGWSGNTDVNNPQLALLIRLDLEILAGSMMGMETRPAGWFGAVASSTYALARDIRHDLELLADTLVDPSIGRPIGWTGADPIMRCSRATQALVGLLEAGGVFTLQVDPSAANFCAQTEIAATTFTEINLLSNPSLNGSLSLAPQPAAASGEAVINSDFAIAFLDRSATLRVGIIPNGSTLTPVGRSAAQFSNMMLIQGEDFLVFVDYQFTSVSAEAFAALPDVDTLTVEPFCGADWCEAG